MTFRTNEHIQSKYGNFKEQHNASFKPQIVNLYYCRSRVRACVCAFAKLDQFLPVRSHFDTKRPVNFFHIATFPSPTFGPLFAFHCPLFFTKNNNLECRDVLKTVTVMCVCVQNLTNFCTYGLNSTPIST